MSPRSMRRLTSSGGNRSNHILRGPRSPQITSYNRSSFISKLGLVGHTLFSCRTKEGHSESYRSPGTTQTRPPVSRELRRTVGVGQPLFSVMGSENSAEEHLGEVLVTRGIATRFLTCTKHKLRLFGERRQC